VLQAYQPIEQKNGKIRFKNLSFKQKSCKLVERSKIRDKFSLRVVFQFGFIEPSVPGK
jgi:hypothetical protein